MVVLTGNRDISVGGVESPPECGDGVVGVVTEGSRGRHRAVEEREGVIAQVQHVDLEVIATGQSVNEPRHRLVGKASRTS